MPERIVLLATLVVAAAFCAESQPADDPTLIVKTDGTKIPVLKIVQDDYLYVVGVTKGGGQIKVPSHAVRDVLYADRDANYNVARRRPLHARRAVLHEGARSDAGQEVGRRILQLRRSECASFNGVLQGLPRAGTSV